MITIRKEDEEKIEKEIKRMLKTFLKINNLSIEKIEEVKFFDESVMDSINEYNRKVISRAIEKDIHIKEKRESIFQIIYDSLKSNLKFDVKFYIDKEGRITSEKNNEEQLTIYKMSKFNEMYAYNFLGDQ